LTKGAIKKPKFSIVRHCFEEKITPYEKYLMEIVIMHGLQHNTCTIEVHYKKLYSEHPRENI
jgi:hypothetical protein